MTWSRLFSAAPDKFTGRRRSEVAVDRLKVIITFASPAVVFPAFRASWFISIHQVELAQTNAEPRELFSPIIRRHRSHCTDAGLILNKPADDLMCSTVDHAFDFCVGL